MSAASIVVNLSTLELPIGLICSSTKASKGPCMSDIENEDLLSISRTHRTDYTNPESAAISLSNKGLKSLFSISGHVPYRPTDTVVF